MPFEEGAARLAVHVEDVLLRDLLHLVLLVRA